MASVLLLWLAAPYWPSSVDDVYIPIAYAWEWLESGELRWTSGERVEGYSNFAWLLLLRVAVGLGLDGAVAAKALALTSSVALLGFASRVLPRSAQGSVLLLAMVAWAPFARWSVDGMETTLYALTLTVGWVAVCSGSWSMGMWVLMLGALARPEGAFYLVLASLVGPWWRNLRDQRLLAGFGALAAFAVYHVCRVAWFGEFLPTPILVKVAPVPLTLYGWKQVAGELATAAGVLVAAGLSVRYRHGLLLALVPIGVQALVVGRASGDWMTGARLLLPGVLASAVAWGALGEARRTGWTSLAVAVGLALTAAIYAPVGYGEARWEVRRRPSSGAPFAGYSAGLETPLAEDVVWAVEQVPEDDSVFVADVGMLGNVPRLRVRDMRGLTQREIAEAIARGPQAEEAGFREYLASAQRPSFLRVAAWGGEKPAELPDWMAARYSLREEFGYSGGTMRWYATHERRPSTDTIIQRWSSLHARFPSQPLLAWRHALALADAGRWSEARELARDAAARWPDLLLFSEAPGSLSFTGGGRPLDWAAGRGFGLYWNTLVRSRPLSRAELISSRLRLDVDNPGAQGAEAEIIVVAECGTTSHLERVHAAKEITVTVPACVAEDEVRIIVRFSNDTSVPLDRNLYVSLASAS